MRDIKMLATIRHINIRKQGEEQEILAIDIKLRGTVSAELVDHLACSGLNEGAVLNGFWQSTDHAPTFSQIINVPFEREYRNVEIKFPGIEADSGCLKKFSFAPQESGTAELTFTANITNPPALFVSRISQLLMDTVEISLRTPQQSLIA